MTAPQPGTAGSRTEPTSVEDLLTSLQGLEQRPLDVQVELLDRVRQGLDAALAGPVTPVTEQTAAAVGHASPRHG